MPVPADWYSPDGQQFVLRFNAQQISDFQMLWLQQSEPAPFPPGINAIGPEGGVVDLPGVATLELPEGALTQKQTIVLKQVFEAASMKDYCLSPDDCYPGWSFAAPIVKILPLGLELEKRAALDLPTYKKVLDTMPPGSIEDIASQDVMENLGWGYYPYLTSDPNYIRILHRSYDEKISVNILSFVSKRVRYVNGLGDFSVDLSPETAPPRKRLASRWQ